MKNKTVFIEHYVSDMDESMVQCCVFCGEIITDYSNAMWPNGQMVPKGFPAGLVYVYPGNPRTTATIIEDDEFIKCK